MAQIGSYVPAKRARLGMHDAILTRMGAYDEIAKGRSTFMVEISETSDILKTCTPKSLVILDERKFNLCFLTFHAAPLTVGLISIVGRGTSTFDGVRSCFTFFPASFVFAQSTYCSLQMAIAHATLQHLITSSRCTSLFITHYPLVAIEIERQFPNEVRNGHMGYVEEVKKDGTKGVEFLYRLEEGKYYPYSISNLVK